MFPARRMRAERRDGSKPNRSSALATQFTKAVLTILGALATQLGWAAGVPHLVLETRLDPAARTLKVDGELRLGAGAAIDVRLNGRSEVHTFAQHGKPLQSVPEPRARDPVWRWRVASSANERTIKFGYVLALQPLDTSLDHRQVLGLAAGVASEEGVYVPDAAVWYPRPDTLDMTYRMSISAPSPFRAVTAGRLTDEQVSRVGNRAVFESGRPLPGIDLIAGPYSVDEKVVTLARDRMVRVRTYFHAELQTHAQLYLDSAARYLTRYDRRIGDYPNPAYNIVSAPLPTGFGMPGIAYLGRQVIRLPFIPATSLGHEVLHEWWGNGVYPDYTRGNWSEGLTTFLADYAFKEDESAAAAQAMRLGWLRDYAAVPRGKDRTLAEFVSRRHGADQAVGYNKTAFVFLMLRDWIGEDAFNRALQQFWRKYRGQYASWADMQREFEANTKRDLTSYFRQWIERAGAPEVRVASARNVTAAQRGMLQLTLQQQAPPFALRVPLRVHMANGTALDHVVALSGVETHAEIALTARAQWLEIDPDVRLFRRLAPDETTPILRQVMLDPGTRVVAGNNAGVRSAARAIANAVFEHEARFVEKGAVNPDETLLVIGLNTEIPSLLESNGLPPVPDTLPGGSPAYAYVWRTADGRKFAVVSAPDIDTLAMLARPLPHLGSQSYVLFDGPRSVARGVWPYRPRRIPIEQ